MAGGSNLTFILKDPMGNLYREFIDACREPIERPHAFKVCGKSRTSMGADSMSGMGSGADLFSIKNNCRTPYCSKLVSEWSPYENLNATSLAYFTIHKDFFDPIQDPDLIDFNPEKRSEIKKEQPAQTRSWLFD